MLIIQRVFIFFCTIKKSTAANITQQWMSRVMDRAALLSLLMCLRAAAGGGMEIG